MDDPTKNFTIIGKITDIKPIAVGNAIRELPFWEEHFGKGRWRKLKGIANVSLFDGTRRRAEVHWYEAHGIGKKE